MWPNEKRFHLVPVRVVRLGFVAAALTTILQAQSLAHTVLLSRGTVMVHQRRVVSRIEINAKDFIHYYHLRPTAERFSVSVLRDAVFKHRQHLLEHFILRDARGVRLRGQCVDVRWTEPAETTISYSQLGDVRVTYALEHAVRRPPRYLTFQQHLGSEHVPMPIRLALSVTATDRPTARFIQLTNRGNAETLEFTWSDPTARRATSTLAALKESRHPGYASRRDRFKIVYARLHIDGKVVHCDIYMPLVLLETWLPLRRSDRDFIGAKEMAEARERLRAFFAGHNQILINGHRAAPSTIGLALLGPDAVSIAEPEAERLGAWSARVGVRLTYETDIPVSQVELVWDLFNNVVLNAAVEIVFGDSRSEIAVTPYSPSVSWSGR